MREGFDEVSEARQEHFIHQYTECMIFTTSVNPRLSEYVKAMQSIQMQFLGLPTVSLFSLLLPVIARFCLLLHASACL
jgi:hypothetical protein